MIWFYVVPFLFGSHCFGLARHAFALLALLWFGRRLFRVAFGLLCLARRACAWRVGLSRFWFVFSHPGCAWPAFGLHLIRYILACLALLWFAVHLVAFVCADFIWLGPPVLLSGPIWFGLVRPDLACLVLIWLGSLCFSLVHLALAALGFLASV